MSSIEEWLVGMLGHRDLHRPDRRMLYAYRLEQEEFASLRGHIKAIALTGDWRSIARRNRLFSALFVLYAAEWWRREYSGGAWRWSPIFESVDLDPNALLPNERSDTIEKGFAFWGHRPAGDGKRFFGAVVAHGGLPLKALGQRQNKLGGLMAVVLRQAARYGWDDSQATTAVADRNFDLPESLRRQEIYELIAGMVTTALELRHEFKLDERTDPVAALDQADPSWRNRFPISLEDAFAQNLLVGLVREVVEVGDQPRYSGFAVQRCLRQLDSRKFELVSTVQHCSVLSADSLAGVFKLDRSADLPRYLSVDVQVTDRQPLTTARRILGMDEATIAIASQRIQWRGESVLSEHLLFLRGPNGDLHDGPIAVPGGNWLPDDEPFVFAYRDGEHRLVASGSARLPDDELVIAINSGMHVEGPEGQMQNPEDVGDLIVGASMLKLFRVHGESVIRSGTKVWRVVTRQISDLTRSYVLEGRRLNLRSHPWPVFRGKPVLIQYDDDGLPHRVAADKLRWFAAGTETPVDPATARGPVEVHVFDNAVRLARFRLVLLDRASSETYISSSEPAEGWIQLVGWGAEDVAIARDIGVSCLTTKRKALIDCALRARDRPPGGFPLNLHWRGSRHELTVVFPFPASGGHAYDRQGKSIPSGRTISIRDLPGSRLYVFDQNPQRPQSYAIKLSLEGRGVARHGNALAFNVPLTVSASGMVEVRLIDVQAQIETLLGFSDDLDASVRLDLLAGGRTCYSFIVARYDAELERHVLGFALSQAQLSALSSEEMTHIRIQAIPLTEPTHPPVTFEQQVSQGVPNGTWNTSELDARLAPWLIFPSDDSAIQFRPTVYGGGQIADPDDLTAEIPERCALSAAMAIRIPYVRLETIEASLIMMSEDFAHPSWALMDQLWIAFGRLPLSTLDPFKVLAMRPDLAAQWLVRSQLSASELHVAMRELKKQLGLPLLLTPIDSWREAIRRLKIYWIGLVGQEAAEMTFGITLKDRARILVEGEPSIQLIIDFLIDEAGSDRSKELLDWMVRLTRDPKASSNDLWQGGDSLLMKLLMRNHAEEREIEWPEQHFVKNEVLPEIDRALPRDMKDKVESHANSLFWLQVHDSRLTVINMPVICALWAISGVSTDWWKESRRRLALLRIRAFDPIWFDEAYRHTVASALGFGMLINSNDNRLVPPRPRQGGPRVIRIQRGSVPAR